MQATLKPRRPEISAKSWMKLTLYLGGAITMGVVGLALYAEYSTSFGVVEGGFMPGMAAIDHQAFEAVSHPMESTPLISELKASGRILFIDRETRCRLIRQHGPTEQCEGSNYVVRVKILEGPRRERLFGCVPTASACCISGLNHHWSRLRHWMFKACAI